MKTTDSAEGLRKLAVTVLMGAGLSSLAFGAEFSNVIMRQLAPWQSDVTVDFTLSDVTGPTEVDVTLTQDGRALGEVPACAFTTSRAFARFGKMRVAFNPALVPALAGRTRADGLGVSLSARPLAGDEILYAIFDLEHGGKMELVTREALTNGVWGAWEETIWPNVTAVKTPVWTGVTNDTKYALTHLVMRRIDAGTFKMGYAESSDVGKDPAQNYSQRSVTITKPYYMGVYEFTAKQIRLLIGSTRTDNLNKPTMGDTFDKIRGAYTTAGGPYDWPRDRTVDPNSYIGKLRTRTGVAFDLPTEAQWEKAARAGSDGVYYDGCAQTHMAERNAIAWNNSNTGKDSSNCTGEDLRPVGLLKPNNYGLYDTLGNSWEWVLDWQAGGTFALQSTDPVGAPAAGEGFWSGTTPKRVQRGGSGAENYTRLTLHERSQNPVSTALERYGWRVAFPASEIDGGDVTEASAGGVCVDAAPTATFHWATYGAPNRTIQLDWPDGAQSAKLTIAGRSGETAVVLAAGTETYDLNRALPLSPRKEDVLNLTLEFYSAADAGGSRVATQTFRGLGLLAPLTSVAVSEDELGAALGKLVVLPIPEGATGLTIAGESAPIGTGSCWYGWRGFAFNQAYALSLRPAVGDAKTAKVTVSPYGSIIIIR